MKQLSRSPNQRRVLKATFAFRAAGTCRCSKSAKSQDECVACENIGESVCVLKVYVNAVLLLSQPAGLTEEGWFRDNHF
jgi:hypothetical protein